MTLERSDFLTADKWKSMYTV